jgi:hypothetical protein
MAIPRQVLYDSIKPLGYPTTTKVMRFSPQTGQNNILPNDVVRFNFNTNGYWDPSTVYINLTVQMDPSFRKGDAIQIDGSASSFISEFIATCKGVELERIQEYDQIANILEDVNYSNEQRFTREIQGMGNNNRASTKSFGGNPTPGYAHRATGDIQNNSATTAYILGYNPHHVATPQQPASSTAPQPDNIDTLYLSGYRRLTATLGIYNQIGQTSTLEPVNAWIAAIPLYKNLYGMSGLSDYPSNAANVGNNWNQRINYPNMGFHEVINNDLTQGCFEPALIRGIGIPTMINGRIQHELCERRSFSIPIYSGIFGSLMQKRDLKYLPMQALQDLVLEFRINPNAVFTSGYSYFQANTDAVDLTMNSAANTHALLQRKFVITKFEIVAEMLFFDQKVDSLIQNQLSSNEGVIFHTESWMLGPITSLGPLSTPSGNYQLNMGFESLKKILVTFLPSNPQPFQRKLHRISNAVTSLQLRIGMDLYPTYPIKGHSGTSGAVPTIYSYENNNEYLIALYKAFGKWNNVLEDCSINNVNFAVNSRTTISGETQLVTNAATLPAQILPAQKVTGALSMFYNNIEKGKAVYAVDLEGLGDDEGVISGLNTTVNKPLEIIFTSDSSSPFLVFSDASYSYGTNMYVWCHYDMIVKFGKFSAQIIGRGL